MQRNVHGLHGEGAHLPPEHQAGHDFSQRALLCGKPQCSEHSIRHGIAAQQRCATDELCVAQTSERLGFRCRQDVGGILCQSQERSHVHRHGILQRRHQLDTPVLGLTTCTQLHQLLRERRSLLHAGDRHGFDAEGGGQVWPQRCEVPCQTG